MLSTGSLCVWFPVLHLPSCVLFLQHLHVSDVIPALTNSVERPCKRCVRKGIGQACVEGVRKKAKYLLEGEERGLGVGVGVGVGTGTGRGEGLGMSHSWRILFFVMALRHR